MKNVKRA